MGLTLVTGGAGFIGSQLARDLLESGQRVRVLDDLSTGRQGNIASLDLEFIQGDIRDLATVERAMLDVDLVFHHAAYISAPASLEEPLDCYEINVQGSIHVLHAAQKAAVQRVVLASSAAVYGEAEGDVHEAMPLAPLTPYAASKIAMEQAAAMFSRAYGLRTTCLRYFNVYGPRQSPASPYAAAIPIFISALLDGQPATVFGDGMQTRDFIYVGDVARANLLAAASLDENAAVINISGGSAVTINHLLSVLRVLIPGAPQPQFEAERPGDIRFSSADVRRAAELLDFRPAKSLQAGLEETISWIAAQVA